MHEKDALGVKFVMGNEESAHLIQNIYRDMNMGAYENRGIFRSDYEDPEGISLPHIEVDLKKKGLINVNRRSLDMMRAYEIQILPWDKWYENEVGERSYAVYKKEMTVKEMASLINGFLLTQPNIFKQ